MIMLIIITIIILIIIIIIIIKNNNHYHNNEEKIKVGRRDEIRVREKVKRKKLTRRPLRSP